MISAKTEQTIKLPSNRFASSPKATKAIATNRFIMRTTPAFGTFAITYIYGIHATRAIKAVTNR